MPEVNVDKLKHDIRTFMTTGYAADEHLIEELFVLIDLNTSKSPHPFMEGL